MQLRLLLVPALGVTVIALAVTAEGCGGSNDNSFGFDPDGGPDGGPFFDAGSLVQRPTFPPTTMAAVRPPPISGGTLLVTRDGTHAIASDPDRDLVYGVDLSARKVTFTVKLQAGDEPGRVVEDGSGHAYVALRRGGALVTLAESNGAIVSRRSVCPAPRGVGWDSTTNLVWVTCATGELVSLTGGGGAVTHTYKVERDLRDIVVSGGAMTVTELRSAQVLRLDDTGSVQRRDSLEALPGSVSHVAWRAIPGPSDSLVVAYQNETTSNVSTQVQGGYGGACGLGLSTSLPPEPTSILPSDDAGSEAGNDDAGSDDGAASDDAGAQAGLLPPASDAGFSSPPPGFDAGACGPVVTSVLGVLDATGTTTTAITLAGVLPVDVAMSKDGTKLAVVTPGSAYTIPTLFTVTTVTVEPGPMLAQDGAFTISDNSGVSLQPVAVGFDGAGDLVVQTREPAGLWIGGGNFVEIPLSSVSRADTGIDVFHTQAGADIACASCHPEGGDDGHVWQLNGDMRRTPSLRGTIAGTAPYHWPGDEPTMDALLQDVYQTRMDGAPLDPGQTTAIESWVDAIPAPPAPSWIDAASAQRGKGVFASSSTMCSSCHSGAKFTDNLTVDVGTGGAFQVPPLVGVGWNAPLMHSGCAATIADRFGMCATPQHGSIASLTAQNLADLGMYLESL
jgi:hypothetical protein